MQAKNPAPPFKIIGVASSKGGTGKSTVSINLVLDLARRGVRVGLLDCDLDSPYLSELINDDSKIQLINKNGQRKMQPITWRGLPFISFANYLPDAFGGATMTGAAHSQFLGDAIRHTDWGDIDVLVCDLPAGTSTDEYVFVRHEGGKNFLGLIGVAVPNVVGGLHRLYNTASYHQMPILGVVENMSGEAFGHGTIKKFCAEHRLKYFGSIPLDARIREANERRQPEIPADLLGPIQAATATILEEAGIKAVAK